MDGMGAIDTLRCLVRSSPLFHFGSAAILCLRCAGLLSTRAGTIDRGQMRPWGCELADVHGDVGGLRGDGATAMGGVRAVVCAALRGMRTFCRLDLWSTFCRRGIVVAALHCVSRAFYAVFRMLSGFDCSSWPCAGVRGGFSPCFTCFRGLCPRGLGLLFRVGMHASGHIWLLCTALNALLLSALPFLVCST
jgi:hypothetical protein